MTKKINVLMTGASSFTGAHICRALEKAGFAVHATLTQDKKSYAATPSIEKRLQYASPHAWIEQAPFGHRHLLDAIASIKPSIFIHHGAQIKGYRSPDFNFLASLDSTFHNLPSVCSSLANASCRRIIYSGSFFEPDEGVSPRQEPVQSPGLSVYGVSKKMGWELLRYHAEQQNIALSKIIIPNPIGAFENEDRLIPMFVKMWKAGQTPSLKTSQLIRDQLPATWLAETYVEEAKSDVKLSYRRPSGYVMTNENFVRLFLKKAAEKNPSATKWQTTFEQQPTQEVLLRQNSEPCRFIGTPEETNFWEQWLSDLSL